MALKAEGILEVQPGLGTVVAALPPGSIEDRSDLLSHSTERLVIEAQRLGLTEEQLLTAIRKHWRKLSPPL